MTPFSPDHSIAWALPTPTCAEKWGRGREGGWGLVGVLCSWGNHEDPLSVTESQL